MSRWVVLAAVVVGQVGWAQEIGTEISGPSSSAQPTKPEAQPEQEEPVAPPVQKSTTVGGKKGSSRREKTPEVIEGGVSAAAGAFGIRAGFSSSVGGVVAVGTQTRLTNGTVGIAAWVAEGFALIFDLGGSLFLNNGNALFGASVGAGFDYHFGTSADALRPLFHFSASFDVTGDSSNVLVGVTANVGGGAAYFFSKHFSVTGKLLLTVPMQFPNGSFTIGLFTATPAVGAAWYF